MPLINRPLVKTYHDTDPIHSMARRPNVPLIRGGFHSLQLPCTGEPMMRVGHGGMIPAAQDPTDPATWRVPVVWT